MGVEQSFIRDMMANCTASSFHHASPFLDVDHYCWVDGLSESSTDSRTKKIFLTSKGSGASGTLAHTRERDKHATHRPMEVGKGLNECRSPAEGSQHECLDQSDFSRGSALWLRIRRRYCRHQNVNEGSLGGNFLRSSEAQSSGHMEAGLPKTRFWAIFLQARHGRARCRGRA